MLGRKYVPASRRKVMSQIRMLTPRHGWAHQAQKLGHYWSRANKPRRACLPCNRPAPTNEAGPWFSRQDPGFPLETEADCPSSLLAQKLPQKGQLGPSGPTSISGRFGLELCAAHQAPLPPPFLAFQIHMGHQSSSSQGKVGEGGFPGARLDQVDQLQHHVALLAPPAGLVPGAHASARFLSLLAVGFVSESEAKRTLKEKKNLPGRE